jgi:hypothetical protein
VLFKRFKDSFDAIKNLGTNLIFFMKVPQKMNSPKKKYYETSYMGVL